MRLILVRGLPGSGKSTLAKNLKGFVHFEADMFFLDDDGNYCYVKEDISKAHEWCQRQAFEALSNGKDVVISNTFTRYSEMQPYLDMCDIFGIVPQIVVCRGNFGNIHNVPEATIERMRKRWEE